MGNSEIRWLHRELPDLVRRGVLTEESAAALRRHYPRPPAAAARSIALIVFSSLGALLVGGGVILILAHNWEDLTRPARAAIAVGILLAAQGIGAFVLARRASSIPWREGAGGGVVLATVACIALVSQTYNLGGDVPEFLRTVVLLSLPVVYILDSSLAAALVFVGMIVFLMDLDPASVPQWWFWIFVAAFVPYLFKIARRRDRDWSLLAAAVSLGGPLGLMALGARNEAAAIWTVCLSSLLAAYWAIGSRGEERWRKPFLAVGGVGGTLLMIILTFEEPWRYLREVSTDSRDALTVWITLGACVAAGTLAAAHALAEARASRWHMALPAALVLPAAASWSLALGFGPVPAQIVMNLYLLASGVLFIATGLRTIHLGTINFGLLLVSALAFARFVDADISFLARGIGFIVIGLAFFAVNAFVLSRKKEATP